MGSPTALAEDSVREALIEGAKGKHGLYITAGALWGAVDIQKMADRGTLKVCEANSMAAGSPRVSRKIFAQSP